MNYNEGLKQILQLDKFEDCDKRDRHHINYYNSTTNLDDTITIPLAPISHALIHLWEYTNGNNENKQVGWYVLSNCIEIARLAKFRTSVKIEYNNFNQTYKYKKTLGFLGTLNDSQRDLINFIREEALQRFRRDFPLLDPATCHGVKIC